MSTEETVAMTEPTVEISLEESGVQLRLTATLAGRPGEWAGQQAGEWFGFLWEELRGLANLHTRYRVRVGGAVPQITIPSIFLEELEVTEIEPDPKPEPPRARIEEPAAPVARHPLAGLSKAQHQKTIQAEEDAIAQFIWHRQDCEATKNQIVKAFPDYSEAKLKQRLRGLQLRGIVEFRGVAGTGQPKFGFWFITDAGKERLSGRTPEVVAPHPLMAVLPQTRGKTWLMLGGDATRERIMGIEATFQLKKLTWPTFYDEQPIEVRLREIEREEVDLVICNRWNRRYSRHYQHKARECGKPFVMLSRGINPAQIAEQLRRQPLPQAA